MVADIETALESGLSGYNSVALDAMRDVMEGTDILLLFSTDLDLVERWADTPVDDHWKSFSPRAVRSRLKAAGVKYRENARASVDYRGHSLALHVNPWWTIFTGRGLAPSGPLLDDLPFWEIFSHARELLFAIDRLRATADYDWSDVPLASELNHVSAAYGSAKEMETVFLGLLRNVADREA